MNNRKTTQDLLNHYAEREPRDFVQYDAWYEPEGGDYVMVPDAEGDILMLGLTTELMQGAHVRVLVNAGEVDPGRGPDAGQDRQID